MINNQTMMDQSSISPNLSSVLGKMPHAIWRASEMAVYKTSTLSSSFKEPDSELLDDGWSRSSLIELLVQHADIGEIQLLKLVLFAIPRSQRIALIQPPHVPKGATCQSGNLPTKRLTCLKAKTTTEQILKNGRFKRLKSVLFLTIEDEAGAVNLIY